MTGRRRILNGQYAEGLGIVKEGFTLSMQRAGISNVLSMQKQYAVG